jgi:hypothetical protein
MYKLRGKTKWRVREGAKIKSFATTKKNAKKQVRLLHGLEHGMMLKPKR